MPYSLPFTITLVSDAEPSSGFGTNLVNSLVPRTLEGVPYIPASHLKGLMKQSLLDVNNNLTPDGLEELIQKAFGKEGDKDLHSAGLFCLSDANATSKTATTVKTVTRTALSDWGTATEGTLRTAEAIAAETIFKSEVRFASKPSPALDALIRFSLVSVLEIGGGRNRGCGACYVKITEETRSPGSLLADLLSKLPAALESLLEKPAVVTAKSNPAEMVALKLTFIAHTPICVPELPIVETNAIVSGFAIPASAVQGMILHRIDALNHAVASACFESDLFRAWPLLPMPENAAGIPVRVSTTHRISKLPVDSDRYEFCDEMIEYYDWKKTPKNAPLKASDGVLIQHDQNIELWRSADMPRSLSAHGVHNGTGGDHNLFTVESISVRRFCGLIALPADAAELLAESLKHDPAVQIGKARSVRGSGTLAAEPTALSISLPQDTKGAEQAVFVVQSPLLVDDKVPGRSAKEIINALVQKSGWGEVDESAGSISVLFGWNRHKKGRQQAAAVIEPGAVFRLKSIPANLEQLIVKGIGGGRERGCGAVLPHPGIAHKRFEPASGVPVLASSVQCGKKGYELWKKSTGCGLSASQIGQVFAKVCESPEKALTYLDQQRTGRPKKIWDRWENVMDDVKQILKTETKESAQRTLKVWHDLAVAKDGRNT